MGSTHAVSRPFRAIAHDFVVTGPLDLVAHVERIFSAFPVPEVAHHGYELELAPDRWVCSFDGEPSERGRTPAGLITFLMWHVNQAAVASAKDGVVLHAAAAASEGRAVLLAGPQDAGKTTLVAALAQEGMAYLTDEAVLVEPEHGVAHPYPKPLSLDRGSWPLLPHLAPTDGLTGWEQAPSQVAPNLLAGGIGAVTPIEQIVLVRYRDGAATHLSPLGRAETVAALVAQTFGFEQLGRQALYGLAEVVRSAGCHRLEVGSLDDARRLILDLVGSDRSTTLVGRTA